MTAYHNTIFESNIAIVSENQTLANILKDQCRLYGFHSVNISPSWESLLQTRAETLPDIIVSDEIPDSLGTRVRDVLQAHLTFYDALPVILYSQSADKSPPQTTVPDGLSLVASLYGRDQHQRLVEILHEELGKIVPDSDQFPDKSLQPHLNILIITADTDLGISLQRVLRDEGYYVKFIENGKEALFYIQGINPHIVFVEYNLPELNGLSLFYWIKAAYPDTIVIMMSEDDPPELVSELLKAGVDNFFKKPFDVANMPTICQGIYKKAFRARFFQTNEELPVSPENTKVIEELMLLRESEENFRTLVNASGDIIFRITPQGVLNFASPAVEEHLGYTREDLEEEHINVSKFVHSQDLIRVMAGIRQVIRGSSIKGLECRLMHNDRIRFRWYSINCYPMYNSQKKFVGVGGIARDIASIKEFEKTTQKHNERLSVLNTIARIVSQSLNLEEILSNVIDKVLEIIQFQSGGIFLLDSETNAFALKSCRAFSEKGARGCELLGNTSMQQELQKSLLDPTMPFVIDDIPQHPQLSETVLAEKGFHTLINIPLKSKEVAVGFLIILATTHREIADEDVQFLNSIGNQIGMAIENITLYQQELRAKKRLEELNKLKDDFVAVVSHDLRSPLSAILGTSEVLLSEEFMDPPLTEEQRELVGNIQAMGLQQLHLVNDLLDVAKIESGKLEINPTMADLQSVIKQCYSTLKILANKKNIHLNFLAATNLPRISIDVPKINQVVNNLISNAIKFTNPGGKVSLLVEEEENTFLKVSVIDTGEGIQPEHLGALFSKFHQVKSVGTQGEKGTGLGLAICKNLVELHQGNIWVESRVGIGSTFAFTLPITEQIILIIDDSLFVVKSLEKMLLEHLKHIKVMYALNGNDGLKQVEKTFPRVVILDYIMPGVDGIAVFQSLKTRYGSKVPPTIFLTASQDLEIRQQIFDLGASDYLQKPVNVNDLLPRLSRFL